MYKPITRGLRVQDQPWVHNKSACSCGVCTREARQSISKKLHINPRPCGSKAYLGRRGLHVLMRWKRKERGWDQFQRLQKSLSNGSIGMRDDNRDWREPWTQHSLDHKRRGDPFNKIRSFHHWVSTNTPHSHPRLYTLPPWQALQRRLSGQRPLWGYLASLYMHLPLPQLFSTWVRQAFPPTLKNCCHHFNEDAKTGLGGLRGVWDLLMKGQSQARAAHNKEFQFCLRMCHLLNSWSYPVGAVIGDHRTKPWWLASPTRELWLRWCTPYTTAQRS